jgi:hypothetical protein
MIFHLIKKKKWVVSLPLSLLSDFGLDTSRFFFHFQDLKFFPLGRPREGGREGARIAFIL